MSDLFPNHVEYGLLDMEQLVLCALHVLELHVRHPQLLHFEDLVVAGSLVERVGPLREVVHHVSLVHKTTTILLDYFFIRNKKMF